MSFHCPVLFCRVTDLTNNSDFFFLAEEGLLYRARYFGDSESYKRAQRMGTPSCSRLSEIQVILDG